MGDDCRLEAGELATRTAAGWVMPDGTTVSTLHGCFFSVGSGWRVALSQEPKRARRHMDPTNVAPQVSDDATLLPIPAVPAAISAGEVQPASSPTAGDLAKLADSAAGNPMLTLALAVVAVLGGGSAWKLWTKRSEQSHELAMKRLEIDAATMNGTAQPPPCQAKQAEVDAKLAAFEARVGKIEKTSLALPDGFDADELVGRVGKLEAAIKRMGVKAPTTKGGTK